MINLTEIVIEQISFVVARGEVALTVTSKGQQRTPQHSLYLKLSFKYSSVSSVSQS